MSDTQEPPQEVDELIAETEALLAAATRGPWEWDDDQHRSLTGQAGTPDVYEYRTEVLDIEHDGGCGCRRMCEMDVFVGAADAELIAASPSLLARLVEALRDEHRRAERLTEAAHQVVRLDDLGYQQDERAIGALRALIVAPVSPEGAEQ